MAKEIQERIPDVEEDYINDLVKRLQEAKQYLRTDYRSHVKSESGVPDHCFTHSLSDPGNNKFSLSCSEEASTPESTPEKVLIPRIDP